VVLRGDYLQRMVGARTPFNCSPTSPFLPRPLTHVPDYAYALLRLWQARVLVEGPTEGSRAEPAPSPIDPHRHAA